MQGWGGFSGTGSSGGGLCCPCSFCSLLELLLQRVALRLQLLLVLLQGVQLRLALGQLHLGLSQRLRLLRLLRLRLLPGALGAGQRLLSLLQLLLQVSLVRLQGHVVVMWLLL